MEKQINIIAKYLSFSPPYIFSDKKNNNYDIIVICGNNSLVTIDLAGKIYNKQTENSNLPIIIITGGIGRCTPLLYDKIIIEDNSYLHLQNKKCISDLYKMQLYRNSKKSNHIENMNNIFHIENEIKSPIHFENTIRCSTEAEIFASILHHKFKIPYEHIFVDNYSTNTGENAKNTIPDICEISKQIYQNKKEKINIGLIQDHTMLRRSLLTFSKVFKEISNDFFNKLINLIPISCLEICYNKEYIDLLLGEMTRIQNNENGYGPNGKNFIDDVGEIPDEVKNGIDLLKN